MTTEPIERPRKYSAHAIAQHRNEGRPYGGISCYIDRKLGQVTLRHSDDNYTLVKTDTVTILAMYFKPQTDVETIIARIMSATSLIHPEVPVIIAGDFNCRIDKAMQRSKLLVEALEEEGFRLISNAEQTTYFAPNGSSTIDIIFCRGNNMRVRHQTRLA